MVTGSRYASRQMAHSPPSLLLPAPPPPSPPLPPPSPCIGAGREAIAGSGAGVLASSAATHFDLWPFFHAARWHSGCSNIRSLALGAHPACARCPAILAETRADLHMALAFSFSFSCVFPSQLTLTPHNLTQRGHSTPAKENVESISISANLKLKIQFKILSGSVLPCPCPSPASCPRRRRRRRRQRPPRPCPASWCSAWDRPAASPY